MLPEPKFRFRREPAKVMLGAILIAIALANFVIATIPSHFPGSLGSFETIISLAFGLGFSQMTLAAVWSALATPPATRRVPQAAIVVALVWLSHSAFYGRLGIGVIGALTCGVYWTIWLATQLPLWLLRRRIGLVFLSPGQEGLDLDSDDRIQFGIRGLLIATAVVAIGMSFGRHLAAQRHFGAELISLDAIGLWLQLAYFYLVMTISQALASLPLVLAVLVSRVIVHWVGLASLWFIVISFAETYFFGWLADSGRIQIVPLVWMHGTQYVTLTLVLLLTRQVGWRVVATKWVSALHQVR
jgi:hypothetical protein